MKNLRLIVWLLTFFTGLSLIVFADHWEMTGMTGSSFNLPTPLKIEQSGYPTLDFEAHYETKPFQNFMYWTMRLGHWDEPSQGWEFELLHQKIYLTNNPPEISIFNISDGFNMFMVNRAWKDPGATIFRVGGGFVITHQEVVIRNQPWLHTGGIGGRGYHLSGLCAQVGAEKRFYLNSETFLNAEAKFSVAYVEPETPGGKAYVPNVAFHLLFGFGNASEKLFNQSPIEDVKFFTPLLTPFFLGIFDTDQKAYY